MHREWVQILLIVGLMTTFGLGAAAIALASPDPASQTAIVSLAGGTLFGVLVGVAIVFSQPQTYGSSEGRAFSRASTCFSAVSRRILQVIARSRFIRAKHT
jgi:hypothetical protein